MNWKDWAPSGHTLVTSR